MAKLTEDEQSSQSQSAVLMDVNHPLFILENAPALNVITQDNFSGATLTVFTDNSFLYVLDEQFYIEETGLISIREQASSRGESQGVIVSADNNTVIAQYHIDNTFETHLDHAAMIRIDFLEASTADLVKEVMTHIGYENPLAMQSREIHVDFQQGESLLLDLDTVVITNTPPLTSDHLIEMDGPIAQTLNSGDFSFYDSDGDLIHEIVIVKAPVQGGELQYQPDASGIWLKVEDGVKIPVEQVEAGHLRFLPDTEMITQGVAAFDFQVSDGKSLSDSHSIVFTTQELKDQPDYLAIDDDKPHEEYSDFNMITMPTIISDAIPTKEIQFFEIKNAPTQYGHIDLSTDGKWAFKVDENLDSLQLLAKGDHVEERIPVIAQNGQVYEIAVQIIRAENNFSIEWLADKSKLPDSNSGIQEGLSPLMQEFIAAQDKAVTLAFDSYAAIDHADKLLESTVNSLKAVLDQTGSVELNRDLPVTESFLNQVVHSADPLTDLCSDLHSKIELVRAENSLDHGGDVILVKHEAKIEIAQIRQENQPVCTMEFTHKASWSFNESDQDDLTVKISTLLHYTDEDARLDYHDSQPDIISNSIMLLSDNSTFDLTSLSDDTLSHLSAINLGGDKLVGNQVNLSVADVLHVNNSDQLHRLIIDGQNNDNINLTETHDSHWTRLDSAQLINEKAYSVYQGSNQEGDVQVLINVDTNVTIS
jgi:VCBS repeat-containing protein